VSKCGRRTTRLYHQYTTDYLHTLPFANSCWSPVVPHVVSDVWHDPCPCPAIPCLWPAWATCDPMQDTSQESIPYRSFSPPFTFGECCPSVGCSAEVCCEQSMHPRLVGACLLVILTLLSIYVAGEDVTVHHTPNTDGTLPHSFSAHTPQVELYCNVTGTPQSSVVRGFSVPYSIVCVMHSTLNQQLAPWHMPHAAMSVLGRQHAVQRSTAGRSALQGVLCHVVMPHPAFHTTIILPTCQMCCGTDIPWYGRPIFPAATPPIQPPVSTGPCHPCKKEHQGSDACRATGHAEKLTCVMNRTAKYEVRAANEGCSLWVC
jgi:hypothetical protein